MENPQNSFEIKINTKMYKLLMFLKFGHLHKLDKNEWNYKEPTEISL